MPATAPALPTPRRTHRRTLFRVGLAAATAAALAGAGLWDTASPRYWRAQAQEAGLAAAGWGLHQTRLRPYVPRMVRAALALHREGITPADAMLAAELLADAGEAAPAAMLHLGLAHQRQAEGLRASALAHARRADALQPGETSLLAVLLLHRAAGDAPGAWITQPAAAWALSGMAAAWQQLRERFPGHPLVQARLCTSGLQDFAVPPPAACAAVPWLAAPAAHGRREHARITAEIESLPRRAAAYVEMAERQQREQQARQAELRQQDQALAAERTQLPGRAFGQAVLGVLPLPQPGDTLERFITREGLCSLPLLRLLCRSGEVALAFNAMREGQQAIDAQRAALAAQYAQAGQAIADARDMASYWQSSRPLDSLLAERARLLPAFRRSADEATGQRFDRVGLPLEEALEKVLAGA